MPHGRLNELGEELVQEEEADQEERLDELGDDHEEEDTKLKVHSEEKQRPHVPTPAPWGNCRHPSKPS